MFLGFSVYRMLDLVGEYSSSAMMYGERDDRSCPLLSESSCVESDRKFFHGRCRQSTEGLRHDER